MEIFFFFFVQTEQHFHNQLILSRRHSKQTENRSLWYCFQKHDLQTTEFSTIAAWHQFHRLYLSLGFHISWESTHTSCLISRRIRNLGIIISLFSIFVSENVVFIIKTDTLNWKDYVLIFEKRFGQLEEKLR